MITANGVYVFPGANEHGVPALSDIALGLARMPRFGGQTQIWWPVLLHSLACQRIAQKQDHTVRQQLICLMHDAHEAVTADIPGFWKTDDMRVHQDDLDRRIFGAMGIFPSGSELRICKHIDELQLRTEIAVLATQCRGYHNVPDDQPHQDITRELLAYVKPATVLSAKSAASKLFQDEVVRLLWLIHGCHIEWAHTSYAGRRHINQRWRRP